MINWKIETRKVSELKNNKKNARRMSKHDAQHLRRSLEDFGVCQPIVINHDNIIIGGHQRVTTLKKMGIETVDVYVPDVALSEDEIKRLAIRLNRNQGEFDFDLLSAFYEAEELIDCGFKFEELHIESLPNSESNEKQNSQKATITITFSDVSHLQEAENQIATIIDQYVGASYKVKIK